jgi:hypothetical protein
MDKTTIPSTENLRTAIEEISQQTSSASNIPAIHSNYQRISTNGVETFFEFFQLLADPLNPHGIRMILQQRIVLTEAAAIVFAKAVLQNVDEARLQYEATNQSSEEK